MGGDSNPWCLAAHTLSRRAQSTALSPILSGLVLTPVGPTRVCRVDQEHDDKHGPELQLQPSEQFIERQLNADKKFAEICILSTHSIETHFVDDFLDLESVSGE